MKIRILDEKLKEKWKNYLGQSIVAMLIVFLILMVFTTVGFVIIAAVGSTTFTVFAMPKHLTAKARNVIGGHVIGALVGLACATALEFSFPAAAALAVGLTTLLMVSTDTEHPPAAGTALGVVLSPTLEPIAFVFGSAIVLASVRRAFMPWLVDLV